MIDYELFQTIKRRQSGPGGLYLYDIVSAIEKMEETLSLCERYSIQPIGAVKALPHQGFLDLLCDHGVRMDITNGREQKRLLAAKNYPPEVFLNGPAIEVEFGNETLDRGCVIPIFSSRKQIQRYAESRGGGSIGFRLRSSDIMGPVGSVEKSRFGFPLEELGEAVSVARSLNFTISILHCHHTASLMEIESYLRILDVLSKVAQRHGLDREVGIILGGGQDSLAASVSGGLSKLFSRLQESNCYGYRLLIEPGAYWLSGSIYFCCDIVSVDEGEGYVDFTVNASPSCSLEWSERKLRIIVQKPKGEAERRMQIRGATCCEYDFIPDVSTVWPRTWPASTEVFVGNLVIDGISPYSVARSRGFNGIPQPKQYTLENY